MVLDPFLGLLYKAGMPRPDVRHGRGAPENRTPTRFNLPVREADGDWLDVREEVDDGPPPLRTTVTVEKPKSIIAWNRSPDIGFDRSINSYRGCEHGCIYCFARPTHAFHDLSPGLDFETKLFAKPDAAKILREELAKPGYVVRLDGDRDQHRSLPADRGEMADHPVGAGGARRDQASGDDHDQVGPGAARPRHPRRRWPPRGWLGSRCR